MSSTKLSHILIVVLPAWGHVRPLLALAVRLVVERKDIVISILLAPSVLQKSEEDIADQFRTTTFEGAHPTQRIRLISTFKSEEDNLFNLIQPYAEAYPTFYQDLLGSKPIKCISTGNIFEPASPPVVIIMDFFAVPQLMATRAITGRTVPVAVFVSGPAASQIRFFGPKHIGGLGDLGEKIDPEVERTGRPAAEVGEEVFKATDGSVVNIPGLPAMYDHEFFPQQLVINAPISAIIRGGYTFFKECDAAILMTFKSFENSGSLTALKSWFAEQNRDAYGIGPLLPLGYGVKDISSSRGDNKVELFLEDMLKQNGEDSVLFFSFGTVFWPFDAGYVEEVINTLIEKKFPFIFCHASPFAKISDELVSKVKSSGIGLMSSWVPQQYILSHPATGWFLTHAGQGGVTEALANGVPMICWPFTADQPAGAAHLSQNLRVAFELIEVRNGQHGMKPMLRNGRSPVGTREAVGIEFREVIDACRGAQGEHLKQNAKRLQAEYAKAWEDGGDGRTELQAFLDKYL